MVRRVAVDVGVVVEKIVAASAGEGASLAVDERGVVDCPPAHLPASKQAGRQAMGGREEREQGE